MKKNLARKLSLAELGRQVNLSPSHLSRIFKAETGQAPLQYLRQVRMERSGELLRTTFLTVREIRSLVGITDEGHFLRDFKKAHGMTPREYRECQYKEDKARDPVKNSGIR